jgi:hypothetical protein
VSDRALTELASAISDGDTIDWPAARAKLGTRDHRNLIDELETLSRLSHASPQPADEPLTLPVWMRITRMTAIAGVIVGTTAHVARLAEGRGTPVLFGMGSVFAAAALLLELGGRDRRARALAVAYWTTAESFTASRALEIASAVPEWPVLRIIAMARPEAMLPACLWYFAREFPRVTRFSRLDAIYRVALGVAVGMGLALVAANVIPVAAPESAVAPLLAPARRLPGWGPVFWLVTFGGALPALAAVAFRARDAAGAEKRRARRFMYVIAFTLGPIAAEVIAEVLIPPFAAWAEAYRWWLGWIVYPLSLALPIGTAYVVAARDVLDVRVVIQRGIRYLLTRWLITWGAIIPIAMLIGYLYVHREQALGVTLAAGPAKALLWSGFVGVALLLARQHIVRMLDRSLLPGAVEPSVMLAGMAQRLKATRTPFEVTAALAEAAERALQTDADAYVRRNGQLVSLHGGPPMPAESVIDVLLAGAREPCLVAPEGQTYHRLLPDADRKWIEANRVHVVMPITGSRGDNRILGMIALRERRNALRYTEDDMRFLRAASASASLACEALAPVAEGAGRPSELEEMAAECGRCGRVAAWQDAACPCGGRWRQASLPIRLSDRFEIVELLGAGGMGVVYRATDLVLKRDVALKTISRLSDAAAQRLLDEAQAMATFSHPQIAVLYGTELWRGTPILIMEFMGGGTLAARLRRGPLSEPDAVRLVGQLAVGLQEVHRSGLFHGDIKPSNIGFTRDGGPKFLDFGLARAGARAESDVSDDGGTRTGGVSGTPAYMTPEGRDGAQPGPALDLWALALVLLECTLGELPVRAANTGREISRDIDRALASIRQRVSPELFEFLSGGLSTEVSARPSTATSFIHHLASLPATTTENS